MVRLTTSLREKVWGSAETMPWYPNAEGRRIGEIWFAASAQFPLLVKLLFTSERMSVQVHPDDAYARVHENSRGKTEMWHVLRAEPNSCVALGLRQPATRERVREIAESGEIEALLNWIPARKGDTFFIPAGTIHAIGAGLVICEVQQLSDVTYRLYDYGRPRELHLDRAMDTATLIPYSAPSTSDCQYFRTEIIRVTGARTLPPVEKPAVCVALEGEGLINGQSFRAGEAFELAPDSGLTQLESPHAEFLITREP